MTKTEYKGAPRLNTVNDAGDRRWQCPVYDSELEAIVSGPGWLYWLDCDPPEQARPAISEWLVNETVWTPEHDHPEFEHATGRAFGYRIDLEVSPFDSEFRWVAEFMSQEITGREPTRLAARGKALAVAASGLLGVALGKA